MRWPLVSRLAFDVVVSERDHLRTENARLSESLVRIGRHEAGMAEQPRPARPPIEPMPDTLKDYIAKWGSHDLRKSQTTEAYKRHIRGVPWTTIEADLRDQEKEQ